MSEEFNAKGQQQQVFDDIKRAESVRLLKATNVTDIETFEQFQDRIQEYVEAKQASHGPTKLTTLNRIYARAAQKVGVSTKDAAMALIEQRRLSLEFHPKTGATILLPANFREQFLSIHETLGTRPEVKAQIWADMLFGAI